MDIETAIYRLLKNDSGVSGVVSGRIFGGVLPQNAALPAIVYRPVGRLKTRRPIELGNSLVTERVQVWSAARDKRDGKSPYSVASELDRLALAALDEFVGRVYDDASPPESIWIHGMFSSTPAHDYQHEDATGLHQFLTEYEVTYSDPQTNPQ